MGARSSYYMILFVYVALWSCQLVACHLTHSLIILVDSYINLYKILDISLGILHLKTQKEADACDDDGNSSLKLFGRRCTYSFKRLPILGSFVNGLFLAALLMSAAIEGIQTCFHASHSQAADETSILLQHPFTYPSILVGFALVGLIMQWSSTKAHQLRDRELGSESLLELNQQCDRNDHKSSPSPLNASKLESDIQERKNDLKLLDSKFDHETRRASNSIFTSVQSFLHLSKTGSDRGTPNRYTLNSNARHRSLSSLPIECLESTNISLKSLRVNVTDDSHSDAIKSTLQTFIQPQNLRLETSDGWIYVRYFASPVALVICALIVYFIHHEMVTEIADAGLAILVVVLLFIGSYPPMKKAGFVLLQRAPERVEPDTLKAEILNISPQILDVRNFHLWSLTPRSNRVATCQIVLDKNGVINERQVVWLINEVRRRLIGYNIKCTSVEPNFIGLVQERSSSGIEINEG